MKLEARFNATRQTFEAELNATRQTFVAEINAAQQTFDAELNATRQTLGARLNATRQTFVADFGKVQHLTEFVGGEPYTGEYAVKPKVEAQTMPTRLKIMLEDVTIHAIPYAEVTNNANGTTATIG